MQEANAIESQILDAVINQKIKKYKSKKWSLNLIKAFSAML